MLVSGRVVSERTWEPQCEGKNQVGEWFQKSWHSGKGLLWWLWSGAFNLFFDFKKMIIQPNKWWNVTSKKVRKNTFHGTNIFPTSRHFWVDDFPFPVWWDKVDGRNPKQPPGMVLKPCKSWDIYHISWCKKWMKSLFSHVESSPWKNHDISRFGSPVPRTGWKTARSSGVASVFT